MKIDEIDEFGRFVAAIVKKEQLIQGLFDFLDLAKENNVAVNDKIAFLGEYQRLLFESIILDISYILFDKDEMEKSEARKDKAKEGKSRMRIEREKVEDKLRQDIAAGIADTNYTVLQKERTLKELESIKSADYRKAINAIKTTRNKYIAHKDPDFSGNSVLYEQLKLVLKNIKRCYEIRQLVLSNIGEVCISSSFNFDHLNIIEALILQQEIKVLRDSGGYDEKLWKTQKRYYSDNLDFWKTEIKPRMTAMDGDDEQA